MTPTGAPIVLLHGVGLDQRMWQSCRPLLAAAHPLLTPDLPGHGGAPPIRGAITLAEMAAAVADGCPDGAHLVGFSLGALVAQQIALEHPERIRSLTLISSVALRDEQQRAAVNARLTLARRDPHASQAASIARWTGEQAGRLPAEAVSYLDDVLQKTDRNSFLAAYEVFAAADQELWPELPGISAPTLVFTGAEDPGSTPRMTDELARRIPGARAQIVPGARHLLPLEQPLTVSELILEHLRRNP